jgi:hypothetical protein
MDTQSIVGKSLYNNALAKLTINLSDGKTMCANVLDADKKKYIKKEIDLDYLTDKYFNLKDGKYCYSNPKE